MNTWPDAGTTPFRGEKNSNWEGAFRVPCLVRYPRLFPAGAVLNGILSHNDWFVTLSALMGMDDIADRLKAGTELGKKAKSFMDSGGLVPDDVRTPSPSSPPTVLPTAPPAVAS